MKQRGMSLVELMMSLMLLVMALFGMQMLLITGLKAANNTTASTTITQTNAQAIRRAMSNMNEAMSATISDNGRRIDYVMPQRSNSVDTITGQKEFTIPLVSDGVSRYFRVTGGKLIDESGRTIARDITERDLDPNSSQYNQTYAPFQFTTIGSTRAITVNFVTSQGKGSNLRYTKMKSTIMLRNVQ